MYVCMYVCMDAWMHGWMDGWMYVCMHVCMYVIEKLSGSGRDENGIPIPGVTVERQKKETKWMLTLHTTYPYLLNGRIGDEYMAEKDSTFVVNKFLPMHRLYKRPEYNYSKIKLDNSFL